VTEATIHFDGGGMSPGPVVSSCVVELNGSTYEAVEHFDKGTHNVAEYGALMLGLRLALKHGARRVTVRGDSRLVVNQVNGEWRVKERKLQVMRAQAVELLARFESWDVGWIPREENRRADALGRA
jgi:ribonuclease HI